MKLYHGTIKQFADHIKREGLKPEPAEALAVALDTDNYGIVDMRKRETEHLPHVTKELSAAKEYARFRADYERASYGQWIAPVSDPNTEVHLPKAEKLTHEQNLAALPVVLTLELPEDWPLVVDKHDYRGLVSTKPIPAHYVTDVISV